MSTNTQGYAIRRNSTCGDEEVKCHQTWENDLAVTMACCPQNSHCNNSGQPNDICCPNGLNCTKEIESKPATCADQRWNLYDKDGEFCCEHDQSGYYIENSIWVGCYTDASDVDGNYIGLPILSTGSLSTPTAKSSTSASTATSTSTSTSTSAAASTGGSHINTGAIAGGIVGGVVGVAAILTALYFLLRSRKRQDQQSTQPLHHSQSTIVGSSHHPSELEEQNHKPVEAVLEYPPQREYPAYPVPVHDHYNQSQQLSSPDHAHLQYSQHPNSQQCLYPSPSESTPAQIYSGQQLHELPTDRNSRLDYKH